MTTSFLSSFELLFEPITPKTLNPNSSVPDPVIVQAYFVLISNVGTTPIDLTLTFKTTLPLVDKSVTIFDTTNDFSMSSAKKFPLDGVVALPTLNASETGLFLLQPDIISILQTLPAPIDITSASFAARGYVQISASTTGQALITPQTRGTFLNEASIVPLELNVIAQEAYCLSTPTGNLFTF